MRRLLNKFVKPVPPESPEFLALRQRLQKGKHGEQHDELADLLLQTHDSVRRIKTLQRRAIIESRVFYFIAVGVAAFSLMLYSKLDNLTKQQREGRSISLGVTCSALGAVIEGGQAAIGGGLNSTALPDKLEQSLVDLGFPPAGVREQQAKDAGKAYAALIATRVQTETGVAGLVRRNGTVDCDKLRQIAHLPPAK